MNNRKNLTIKLLEVRVQDLKAAISCYSSRDPYLRIVKRELRSLENKLKHNKGKS